MRYSAPCFLAGTLLSIAPFVAHAQQAPSPYRTPLAVDAPITGTLLLAAGTGYYLMQQKHGPSLQEQARLNPKRIPVFDRSAAGNYSAQAQQTGNVLCFGSLLAAPGLLALDNGVRGRYGQVLGLYLQAEALTDALFTMSAGTIERYRPLVYSADTPDQVRSGDNTSESFFAGHTAHTATATFFAAKVYHDFHPGSAAGPWVWGAAAAIPALVACTRTEAGKHFLSDNLVGYAVGAASGILVPQLHKVQRSRAAAAPAVLGATAGAATGILLPQLGKLRRNGLSIMLLQGTNANGYAYGGLRITQRL